MIWFAPSTTCGSSHYLSRLYTLLGSEYPLQRICLFSSLPSPFSQLYPKMYPPMKSFSFHRPLFLFFFFVLPLFSFGQSTTIQGQVRDGGNRPVSFANVLLLQAQDSALFKGTLSDEAGNFRFENVGAGFFRVKSFLIGYKQQVTPPFTITPGQQSHRLPPLELSVEARQLNEVTVEAQKPLFEQHLDKLVVNVQSSITSAGATALEVLERSLIHI